MSVGRDPLTGRYRYVNRTIRGGKRTAQRAAAQLINEVEHGGHRQAARGSLAQLLDQWMTHIEAQGRAASTLARYRSALSANIVPAVGHIRVDRLTASDLDAFYASLLKKGLNPLSVRKCHAIISAALHQALRWGWIDRNPAERASPPSTRQREVVVPKPNDVRQLLEACEESNADLASLIYVAATTGCRRGELCGLRWSDIDLDQATLVVARSISDTPNEIAVKTTKTHQSRRIALDPSTVEVLRRHRTRVDERAEASGTLMGDSAYVWSQALDGSAPYRPDRVTGAFRGLRDRVGLPEVTFHGLRHFAATTLAGRGVGVRTIAGRLGHANPNVTLRTYTHFLEVADREAAAVMGDMAAAIRPTAHPKP